MTPIEIAWKAYTSSLEFRRIKEELVNREVNERRIYTLLRLVFKAGWHKLHHLNTKKSHVQQ